MQMLGFGIMALIYAFPSEASNWDKEAFRTKPLWQNYWDNIKHGPTMDTDNWYINYLAHPYVGTTYYAWGRDNGLNDREARALSLFFSTIYWEFGWEALIERPSVQDLIFTPMIGSLLGRYTYQIKEYIDQHDGKLFHSRILGGILKSVIDPIGQTNHLLERGIRAMGLDPQMHVQFFFEHERAQRRLSGALENDHRLPMAPSTQIGLRVTIRF